MFQKDLQLTDLVNLEEWQKIQDSFSEVLEVTLRTFSKDGRQITGTSRPNRLCEHIIPSIVSSGSVECACNLSGNKISISSIKKETAIECHFGLSTFIIPIMAVGNRVTGYMLMGPMILKARRDLSAYAEDAKKTGIKEDELIDALIEINVFSYSKAYSMQSLVKKTFTHMAQTGYHKRRLGEIAPEVMDMDPLFSRYYEEKVLGSLLNSCTIALDADSGSVMTLDKNTNMLHIKVSSKLDENMVGGAGMKVGEGIAGFAAATAEPIILPKDKDKNHLSEKMKRSNIKSSMIVPFMKGNTHEVYGVINLNIVRKESDFSSKDISVVKELVNLASIALTPVV